MRGAECAELGRVRDQAREERERRGRRAGLLGAGPRVGKGSRPGWVVFGIGLGCHLGSWAGWVLGFF